MFYRDIKEQVLDIAGADAGDDFEDMVNAAINRTYRFILNQVDADNERREFSLTTAASTSQYGMPLYVKQVLNIDDATNNRRVYDISSTEFDSFHPGATETGTPREAYPLGAYGVQTQPSANETLDLVSDSAADSGVNFPVRITGFNASGHWVTETVTMTGVTTVATSNTYSKVERVTKAAASGSSWTGIITVKMTTTGTTLAVIPSHWDAPTFLWYEFRPIPSAALTYTIRAIMRKPDLKKDEDWPEIDEEFHNLIVWGSAAEVLPAQGLFPESQSYGRRFDVGVKSYKDAVGMSQPNRIRVFADVTTARRGSNRPLIPGVDYFNG